jgi:uncharacterized membrane protein (UPF0127 family)
MITVHIDSTPFKVELLSTPKQQEKGFMGSKRGPWYDSGLLFIYPSPRRNLSFWMKNVPFDLELLVFDGDGVLREIKTLKAMDERSTRLDTSAMCVLETKPGSARKNGFEIGETTIQFDE